MEALMNRAVLLLVLLLDLDDPADVAAVILEAIEAAG
jgi:hypothetical protein